MLTRLRRRAAGGRAAVPGGHGDAPRLAFRADVEGLRGVATALVLLYHAGVPALPGGYVGLDVFFVISGFLITALVLRELRSTGTVSLRRFYARRIRRLLPSVVVVLAATAVAAAALMTPVDREATAGDVLAANLYVVNWRFAEQQLDYFAADLAASPVQHFWSLSVEEQFYVVWPVLLLGAALWRARRGRDPLPAVAALVVLVGAALLAYSIRHTAEQPSAAYFSTLARGWEFAVGALIAVIPARAARIPARAASLVVVASAAALAWAAVTYSDATRFPGAAALVPALASAAIIAAGLAHARTLPARLLAAAPNRWVGRISYSWYLWHWPLLVFASIAWGDLSVPARVAVVAASVVPAWIAHRAVEEPFRRSRRLAASPGLTLRLGVACTAVVALVGLASWTSVPSVPVATAAEAVGARALERDTGLQASARAIRPAPRSAVRDRGRADADGCLVRRSATRSPACVYGDPLSRTTVVLFGDSHAMQAFPALEPIARRRGWRLVVLTKAGCTPAAAATWHARAKRRFTECERWRDHALRRVARERPALVVAGNLDTHVVVRDGRRLEAREGAAALERGLAATLRRLRATGARVAVIGGVPHPPIDARACVSRSLRSLRDCSFPRRAAYDHPAVNLRAARRAGARSVDLTPVLCPGSRCPAVIGNVLVYRNTTHVTATYMATVSRWLERRLPRPARR
ncbi:acyltransferase family protein [Miltoncostaea marina]|uniref:acyltransferase family protein n=1 Tax=Miltoncostaea marina TaxID=2843215 RepID=UPI001C3E4A76|nr:acyltransferase family protein [Miltoncostaea marina]